MLISFAALLLMSISAEDRLGDDYAQCAYIAGVRSQSDNASESEKKEWAGKASRYIDKAMALAYPGKPHTDANLAALGDRAQTLLNDRLKDLEGDEAEIAISTLLMTCDA